MAPIFVLQALDPRLHKALVPQRFVRMSTIFQAMERWPIYGWTQGLLTIGNTSRPSSVEFCIRSPCRVRGTLATKVVGIASPPGMDDRTQQHHTKKHMNRVCSKVWQDAASKQNASPFFPSHMKNASLFSSRQMITLGGDAELELVDSLDPFSEGIVFSVRPPKKSWKNIANLSGGEKTLSSLALVFALHHFKVVGLDWTENPTEAL